MEFVRVVYPIDRDVHIDGQRSGKTNTTLLVERGTHDFSLSAAGEAADYLPLSVRKAVVVTSDEFPLVIGDFRPRV